jgi:hypothetical protein
MHIYACVCITTIGVGRPQSTGRAGGAVSLAAAGGTRLSTSTSIAVCGWQRMRPLTRLGLRESCNCNVTTAQLGATATVEGTDQEVKLATVCISIPITVTTSVTVTVTITIATMAVAVVVDLPTRTRVSSPGHRVPTPLLRRMRRAASHL